MSSPFQNFKDFMNKKLKLLNYINTIHKGQSLDIPKQHKLNIRFLKYWSIFIGINSMIFSGISLKLYSRVKAFGMIGCVVYVNICWYMIWIESLYRDTILKEKGKLGYLYRKDFREKFGDLPKKQEDQRYEQLLFKRVRT